MTTHIVRSLINLVLTLILIFEITSCESNPKEDWDDPASRAILEALIAKGDLLTKVEQKDDQYTFYFETTTVAIPVNDILSIREEPEQWRTILTFSNHYDFYIPSLGSSIEKAIREIKVNPTGYNPLSANVKMDLPVQGRIKVIIHSKNEKGSSIEHLYTNTNFQQEVTILGLYANHNNQVDLILTDKSGNERSRTHVEIKTAPLTGIPLPKLALIKAIPEKMEPGMTLINYLGETDTDTHCPFMVDETGEIRWILTLKKHPELEHLIAHCGLQRMRNGNFITGDAFNDQLIELDMLGNIVHKWNLREKGYSFHHEVMEMSDGNLLATVSRIDAKLSNNSTRSFDHIIEFNPEQGNIIKEWDLSTMLDITQYQILTSENTPSDWAHNNAICTDGNNFIVSMRNIGLMKFNRSGEVKWILSPHKGWKSPWKESLLKPLDNKGNLITDSKIIEGSECADDFDWSWGPHCPIIMPNGNLLVFDNGFYRRFEDVDLYGTKGYSRAVEYKINDNNHTVQQIWQYGKERGRSCFSVALSSVSYLPQTNHVLFSPGVGTPNINGVGGKVIEVDYQTKEILYELQVSTPSYMAFHRANRMSLYPENF